MTFVVVFADAVAVLDTGCAACAGAADWGDAAGAGRDESSHAGVPLLSSDIFA